MVSYQLVLFSFYFFPVREHFETTSIGSFYDLETILSYCVLLPFGTSVPIKITAHWEISSMLKTNILL